MKKDNKDGEYEEYPAGMNFIFNYMRTARFQDHDLRRRHKFLLCLGARNNI